MGERRCISPSPDVLLIRQKEPYDFTHYLIVSRTYVQEETNTEEDNDEQIKPRPKKKKRKVCSALGFC